MDRPAPFCREAGEGPTVICLHSNASHSGQWRPLMDRLAARFHVVAIDSYGAGKTADWRSEREISFADEVELLEPVLARASRPAVLVGHSYGAAVAFKAALLHPGRFAGIAAYEPTLFSLVNRVAPADVDGIRHTADAAGDLLDHGDLEGAARCFIDFWMGSGSWDRMPAERKRPVMQSVGAVRRWKHACFSEEATAEDFRRLSLPVLCMAGGRSPRSSRSVVELLLEKLPAAERKEFPDLGHMGPVTHPAIVDAEIEGFLDRLQERTVD